MAGTTGISVADFEKMFNMRGHAFTTEIDKTHGQIVLQNGRIVNVNRHGGSKADALAENGPATHENYEVRVALVKALAKDGAHTDTKFYTQVCKTLGVNPGNLDDDSASAKPLSRRVVKQILQEHLNNFLIVDMGVDAKGNVLTTAGDVADAEQMQADYKENKNLADKFTWTDSRHGEALFAQLCHVGCALRTFKKGNTSAAAAYISDNLDTRTMIRDAIRQKAEACTNDVQRRMFLAYVLSPRGIGELNNASKGKDGFAEVLNRHFDAAVENSEVLSEENLSAWCAFVVDDPDSSYITKDGVRFLDQAVEKLDEWVKGVAEKEVLSTDDLKRLIDITTVPDGMDSQAGRVVRQALARMVREKGIVNPEFLRRVLSKDHVNVMIGKMLNVFKENVDADRNTSIANVGGLSVSFDQLKPLLKIKPDETVPLEKMVACLQEVEKDAAFADQTINGFWAIEILLEGAGEIDRGLGLVNVLSEDAEQFSNLCFFSDGCKVMKAALLDEMEKMSGNGLENNIGADALRNGDVVNGPDERSEEAGEIQAEPAAADEIRAEPAAAEIPEEQNVVGADEKRPLVKKPYGDFDDTMLLVNSGDSLTLLEESKNDPDADKRVVFEPTSVQEPQPKASDKFHQLAADLVKLADSTEVDSSLATAETKQKLQEERTYVEDKMKILDLKGEALETAEPEIKEQHKKLKGKFTAYLNSARAIPDELLVRKFVRKIQQAEYGPKNEIVLGALASIKTDVMQANFQAPQDNIKLKIGDVEYDSADVNSPVKVWMSTESGAWMLNEKDKQTVTLLDALKNIFGSDEEYPRKLSLVEPTGGNFDPAQAIGEKNARRFFEACLKKEAAEIRPQYDDVWHAVSKMLPDLVKIFKDGLAAQGLSPMNSFMIQLEQRRQMEDFFAKKVKDLMGIGELPDDNKKLLASTLRRAYSLFRGVLSDWKDELSESANSEARELLRRELLSERSSDGVEDTADTLRLVAAIRQNQDALAELISLGKDAKPCPDDSAANEMLAIFAKDDGFCTMLGISDVERGNKDLCAQKIKAFLEAPQVDSNIIRKLNGRVRAFVNGQLALAQDTFNQLIDKIAEQRKQKSSFDGKMYLTVFNPDVYRLAPKGKNAPCRPNLPEIQEKIAKSADAVGYGKFLKTALMGYFVKEPLGVKLNLISSRLRHSPDKASSGEQLGALFKGAGPLLQKMLQAFDPQRDPDLMTAVRDVKSNLTPIPQEMLKAHLLDIVKRSKGQIEKITVKKTLGCASVGQTLLCRMEGPGVKDGGVDVVVKVIRPDAMNMLRQERDFLLRCANEVEVRSVYQSIIDKTLEEFDMTLEAKNIEASKVYNGRQTGVQTLNAFSLVEPTPGTLLLELAPGQTLDGYFGEAAEMQRQFANKYGVREMSMTETALDYYTIMLEYDRNRKEARKYGYVSVENQRELFKNIKSKVDELRETHKRLVKLTEVWIETSCTARGTGFYHGDLHAGNIMIDPKEGITAIDMGNVSTFKAKEKNDFLDLLGMCNEVKHDFAKITNEIDNMPPKWIKDNLSPLADRFYARLKEMLSPESAKELEAQYEHRMKTVKYEENLGNFTPLKHEFMVILSSSSLNAPAPFDRLSVLLTRLEGHGIVLPEAISRFLSAAMRIKAEVNHLVDTEYHINLLFDGLRKRDDGMMPQLFSILQKTNGISYDDETHRYSPLLKNLGKREFDRHATDLANAIKKAGKSLKKDGKEWEKIQKDIEWLQNNEFNKRLAELKENYTTQGADALAKAICEYEVQEYNMMITLYGTELAPENRPSTQRLETFETIFNRVVSGERMPDQSSDSNAA